MSRCGCMGKDMGYEDATLHLSKSWTWIWIQLLYLLHNVSYFIIRFLYKVLSFTCVTFLINEIVTAPCLFCHFLYWKSKNANRTLWYNGIIIQVSVQHWVPVSCPLDMGLLGIYQVSRYCMPQLHFKGDEMNSRVRRGKKNLKVQD